MIKINLQPKRAPWGVSYQKENDYENQIRDADLAVGSGLNLHFDSDPTDDAGLKVEALDKDTLLITVRLTSGNLMYVTVERR